TVDIDLVAVAERVGAHTKLGIDSACRRLDPTAQFFNRLGVIVMAMCRDDQTDFAGLGRDGIKMVVQERAGIDHDAPAGSFTHDPRIRAVERHHARIICADHRYALRDIHYGSKSVCRNASPSISTSLGSRGEIVRDAAADSTWSACASLISTHVRRVGGNMWVCPASTDSMSRCTGIHAPRSASPGSPPTDWPCGRTATKNLGSDRRGSNAGVIQCDPAPSKSARNTNPRSFRKSPKDSERASSR